METRNAIIKSTFIGFEDHGILTAMLYLNYSDCEGQGFGGYSLAAHNGSGFIEEVLKVVGVKSWEQLDGKHIRVRATHDKIHAIGNILEEKWFCPFEYFTRPTQV